MVIFNNRMHIHGGREDTRCQFECEVEVMLSDFLVPQSISSNAWSWPWDRRVIGSSEQGWNRTIKAGCADLQHIQMKSYR